MSALVRAENLHKTFRIGFWRKKVPAVRGVSFDVRDGEIFGLVGPNGAGKTTTIKMLTGLISPDEGSIEILGHSADYVASRRELGYLPEGPYFYEHLRVGELLVYYGSLHGLSRSEARRRADELVERVGLDHARDRPLRKFSKGMRQRAGIAQALINDPSLVILDEPQSGLDPVGRKEVRDLIFDLKRQGKTIFFSSHILPDVEAICDRVAVMHRGQIQEIGSLHELTSERTASVELLVRELDSEDAMELAGVESIEERAEILVLQMDAEADLHEVIAGIDRLGGELYAVTPQKEDLEDVFLRDTVDEEGDDAGAMRNRTGMIGGRAERETPANLVVDEEARAPDEPQPSDREEP